MAKTAKRPGRPRLSTEGKGASKILALRLGADMRKRLDKWAKAQADKPQASEAVRRLLDSALTAAGL